MPGKSRPIQHKPELMSPAGEWASLRAALRAGADAVYFGLRGLNMRGNYKNFTPGEMQRIAAECHKAGARAYLALNTIIYENELAKVERILKSAKAAGIDAVICWDMAVVRHATALGLPVFLSTQMSVSNSESLALFYRTFGIRRFVLARECSLAHIASIRRRLKKLLGAEAEAIELEVFAHGAMCVSLSGRCFLSQDRFGKSGNRGECIQPCRREYKITDVEDEISFRLGSNYILSPDDLCTMPFLDQLLATGVRYNGQLGTKSLDVFGLPGEITLGDKEREVGVLSAGGLDPLVNLGLNVLPDGVAVGANHHGATDRAVIG